MEIHPSNIFDFKNTLDKLMGNDLDESSSLSFKIVVAGSDLSDFGASFKMAMRHAMEKWCFDDAIPAFTSSYIIITKYLLYPHI